MQPAGPVPGTQFCEIAQGIQREDRPVAQLAIGRLAKGQPLQLTILVPVNASFASAPVLLAARETEGTVVELAWRRCLPAGCTADAALGDDVVQRMRTWSDQARIGFVDAVGRSLTLPFSPRGLAQALDALAKEEATDVLADGASCSRVERRQCNEWSARHDSAPDTHRQRRAAGLFPKRPGAG